MKNAKNDISERLLEFAANIIKLVVQINKTGSGRHIGGQLTRSATSAGANYEEACSGESRADFIHKLHLVLKELRESFYWLRLIKKAGLVPGTDPKLSELLQEAKELSNIIAASIFTAKKKK